MDRAQRRRCRRVAHMLSFAIDNDLELILDEEAILTELRNFVDPALVELVRHWPRNQTLTERFRNYLDVLIEALDWAQPQDNNL